MSEKAEQTNKIAKLFDLISDSYDRAGVDFFQPIAAGLSEALRPLPGESWLDIGCGRGAVAEHASAKLGDKGMISCFDISARMIENAQSMVKQKNLANVNLFVDDAQSPTKVEGRFDAISSCLVLFFLPDPLEALRNWRKYLVSSGRIGVTTFGVNDPGWQEIDQLFEKYLPVSTLDARASGIRGPFASDEGMEALLTNAGYHEVRTVKQMLPVRFQNFDKWYEFSWSTGQRGMWLQVPEGERAALRSAAEAILAKHMQEDGSITFYQEIRHTLADLDQRA